MNMKLLSCLTVAALTMLAACGQNRDSDNTGNEPQTLTPATPPAATPPATGNNNAGASGMMPPECDFSDHDTSKMSDAEHRQMMEQCESAKRRNNNPGSEGSTTSPGATPSTTPSTTPQQ